MFPLLAAFLLAAWLIQPWSYVDIPGEPALAQSTPVTHHAGATLLADDTDILSLKRLQTVGEPAPPAPPQPPAAPAAPTPSPAPTPPPAPAVQAPPADGLEALVCSLPWPCEEALAVARCESGVDKVGRLDGVFASSGSSYGLFQINHIHARRFPDFWESWMNPAKNTAWAFQIWSEQGWRPWSCRP